MKTKSVDILSLRKALSRFKVGKRLISYLIGFINPHSGSLEARVEVLEKGYTELSLKYKQRNRNHLDSMDAITLTNLSDLTSGQAVLASLDKKVWILKHISVDVVKKARRRLRAELRCVLLLITDVTEMTVSALIFNTKDEMVCTAYVRWRIGRLNE